MDKIRLGILQDNMGTSMSTPKEEREEVVNILRRRLGYNVELADYSYYPRDELFNACDLLVVDVGGLSASHRSVDYEMRAVRDFANNNPSKLVILWTGTTSRAYQDIGDEFVEENNIVFKGYFDDENLAKKLLEWYGEPDKTLSDEPMPVSDRWRGVYNKYTVIKNEGNPIPEGEFVFVLRAKDPHSLPAILAYAESCADDFPVLSQELFEVAQKIEFGD